jgi:sugar phosphate isomerase/epimerase
MSTVDTLAISPCCNPELTLEEALAAYAPLGFTQFEAFTTWAKSALDITADPDAYARLAARHGFRFTSFHLPPVDDDVDASLARAVNAARFAKAVGARIVLFKATSRRLYIGAAGPFLDAIEGLGLTPVLQNHYGTPISSLEDFREVLAGIGDARMKTLLEVGQFHAAGVSWRAGYELLGTSVALVHIKDQIGRQSVPYGRGEIDLPGLFAQLRADGYTGDYVVEMEVADRENTLRYLAEAVVYLREQCLEGR